MKPGKCEFADLVYNTKLTPQGLARAIQQIVRDVQSRDRLDAFQIIAAGKEHGPLSTRRINVMVAEMLRGGDAHRVPALTRGMRVMYVGPNSKNPHPTCLGLVIESSDGRLVVDWEDSPHVEVPLKDVARAFVNGDKVVCTSNLPAGKDQPPIRNGEVGVVTECGPAGVMVAYRSQKRRYHNTPEDIRALSLAYALTTHKVQGQECAEVLVVLHSTMGDRLFSRNMLYTSVTRPTERLHLMGDVEAIVLRSAQPIVRRTVLAELPKGAVESSEPVTALGCGVFASFWCCKAT